MITERQYVNKVSIEHRKKFAQFFTPEPIADFMAAWILHDKKNNASILEPAFGLGIFSKSLYKINPTVKIVGYDIDETIYSYACENFPISTYNISLRKENYLTSSWLNQYDGIICNPPYLKFHDYDNTTFIPQVNSQLNIRLNGFTNIYSLFLLKSISQLKDNGRLAYIVPSEFLNSDYGIEVKRVLLESGTLKHVIVVDFNQCAFNDALTTACILLCQKDNYSDVIHFSKIKDIAKLDDSLFNNSTFLSNELKPEIKWKYYYEDKHSVKYNNLVPFSTFAKVSRGIATGANDYFAFNASKIDTFNIPQKCFLPCICHASDVQNLVFNTHDFDYLSKSNKNVFLFNGKADETDIHVKRYINIGVEKGINKKYLTSCRSPWYALEKRMPAPIWVTVFNRKGLRFVRNKAGVYNLTTFHCIYNNNVVDTEVLFAYLVTDVAKEIFLDNSRQYGKGLIKFEPNDLNNGNIVDLRLLNNEEKKFVNKISEKLHFYGCSYYQLINLLDKFFRKKYTSDFIDLSLFEVQLNRILDTYKAITPRKIKSIRVKQLNLLDLFDEYGESSIVENNMVREDSFDSYDTIRSNESIIDISKNVLIGLVKKDNQFTFENQSAKIYYTGKKFPSTIALNNLYYFMPYIKHKGIRDLYIIKIVRIGTQKDGQIDNNLEDLRLVFEIQFVKQLFTDYKPIVLNIWRTFADAILNEMLTQ